MTTSDHDEDSPSNDTAEHDHAADFGGDGRSASVPGTHENREPGSKKLKKQKKKKKKPPAGQRGRFIAARPPALAPREKIQDANRAEATPPEEDYSTLSMSPADRERTAQEKAESADAGAAVTGAVKSSKSAKSGKASAGAAGAAKATAAAGAGATAGTAADAAHTSEHSAAHTTPQGGASKGDAGSASSPTTAESGGNGAEAPAGARGDSGEKRSASSAASAAGNGAAGHGHARGAGAAGADGGTDAAISSSGSSSSDSVANGQSAGSSAASPASASLASPANGAPSQADSTSTEAAAEQRETRRPVSEIRLDNERRAYDQYEFGDGHEVGHSADRGADPASRQYKAAQSRSASRSAKAKAKAAATGAPSTASAGSSVVASATSVKERGGHSADTKTGDTLSADSKQSGSKQQSAKQSGSKQSGSKQSDSNKSDSNQPDSQQSGQSEQPSDADVVRTGGSMAIATLLSRITGFLRTVLIGSALGAAVASAFNTANTLPNLVTELVLGAVLTSLVVPVLVRAEKEDPDRGESFIRRLLTLTFSLTVVITVISVLAAPLLIRLTLSDEGKVNVQMATVFAYLVLPQIFFYAMFAVFMAVLNTKGVFKPGAWAPVINNVVTLVVLGGYLLLPEDMKLKPTDDVTILNPNVILLGLGTTLGVVFQAVIMVPYLRKAGINLKPLWGIDERLKSFASMGVAIILYVAISQAGWAINNTVAGNASEAAPTIYMQAWQLLQMPYGVIGVTLLTAVMPRLSRNAADGDDQAVVRDLTVATRLTMFAMVPIIVFMTAFGGILAPALFAYKAFSLEDANVLGWTVSFSAFTLIPYALVLLHLRVFYAREEVWTPTFIIAGITTTKIALVSIAPFIATEPRLVVVLLGAANGFGFVAGAIIGAFLLRRSLGHLNAPEIMRTSLWALGASIVGALVAWQLDLLLQKTVFPTLANPWFLIRLIIAGVVFLLVTGLVLSRSKLPEIMTVGSALSRLPVVGRFFISRRQAADAASDSDQPMVPEPITPAEAAREAAVANSLLPPLPPLSAGRVRGPRLVPGAPVLDGRYRLLADHGGSSASRFWQARHTQSGDVVGLTILDPLAAVRMGRRPGEFVPNQSRRVLQTKQEMSSRSRAMMAAQENWETEDESLPGLAHIRAVIDSPGSVVVVTDWTAGMPLSAVAESSPDPLAAGYAVADLADAAAVLAERDLSLGVDHRDRIRISTSGGAVLAFPGVLPNNSPSQDAHGIAVALELLLRSVPLDSVPAELTRIYQDAKPADVDDVSADSLRQLAHQLRYLTAGELDVHADETPSPEMRKTGFGARQARVHNMAMVATLSIIAALVVAAVIAALVSVLGGDRQDSPLSPDSIRSGAQSMVNQDPAIVPIRGVQEWMPNDGKGTPDSPAEAVMIADGDSTTVWRSDSYLRPLGESEASTKEGIGLLVDLPSNTRINALNLHGLRPGMQVELRRVTEVPEADDESGAETSSEAQASESATSAETSEAGSSESAAPKTGTSSEPGVTDAATDTSAEASADKPAKQRQNDPRPGPESLSDTEILTTLKVTAPDMHVNFTGSDPEDITTGEGGSEFMRVASEKNPSAKATDEPEPSETTATPSSTDANDGRDGDDSSSSDDSDGEEIDDAESESIAKNLTRGHSSKETEQLLLWITKLPPADGRAEIGEIEVLGTWRGQHRPDSEKTLVPEPSALGATAGRGELEPDVLGRGELGQTGRGRDEHARAAREPLALGATVLGRDEFALVR